MKEEEKTQVLMTAFINMIRAGEMELAQEIEKKLLDKIKFVERDDWFNHAFCGDFPVVDKRCIVFCCPVSKPCPYRHLVLKKLGMTNEDYKQLKMELAEHVVHKS